MNDVMQAVGVFFSYAVLAVFAQNAVFTRGLGVSRLVQLVGDERTSSGWFRPAALCHAGAGGSAGVLLRAASSPPSPTPPSSVRWSIWPAWRW